MEKEHKVLKPELSLGEELLQIAQNHCNRKFEEDEAERLFRLIKDKLLSQAENGFMKCSIPCSRNELLENMLTQENVRFSGQHMPEGQVPYTYIFDWTPKLMPKIKKNFNDF